MTMNIETLPENPEEEHQYIIEHDEETDEFTYHALNFDASIIKDYDVKNHVGAEKMVSSGTARVHDVEKYADLLLEEERGDGALKIHLKDDQYNANELRDAYEEAADVDLDSIVLQ